MKLKRGDALEAYWNADGNAILARPMLDETGQLKRNKDGRPAWDGPTMLERVKGKPLYEQKAIVKAHRKTLARPWHDREGNVVGWSFGEDVVGCEIKPGDPEKRHAEYLNRLREINQRIAAVQQRIASGQATQEDRDALLAAQAEATVVQGEYLEFMALLHD